MWMPKGEVEYFLMPFIIHFTAISVIHMVLWCPLALVGEATTMSEFGCGCLRRIVASLSWIPYIASNCLGRLWGVCLITWFLDQIKQRWYLTNVDRGADILIYLIRNWFRCRQMWPLNSNSKDFLALNQNKNKNPQTVREGWHLPHHSGEWPIYRKRDSWWLTEQQNPKYWTFFFYSFVEGFGMFPRCRWSYGKWFPFLGFCLDIG